MKKSLIYLLAMLFIVSCNKNASNGNNGKYIDVDSVMLDETSNAMDFSDSCWAYNYVKDNIMNDTTKWALLVSKNQVEQEFPYEGGTYALVTLKKSDKYGKNAIITINQGVIYKAEEDCIFVKFDSNEPIRYTFLSPSNGSKDKLLIRESNDFVQRIAKAENIKIELPLYENKKAVFVFHSKQALNW